MAAGRYNGAVALALKLGALATLGALGGGVLRCSRVGGRRQLNLVRRLPGRRRPPTPPIPTTIFFGLLAISGVVIALVLALIVGFSIRYRKGSTANRADMPEVMSREFEIGWTAATFFLFLFVFWWVGSSQLTNLNPPEERHGGPRRRQAVDVEGAVLPTACVRSTALHAPVGTPVRLVMTSQDVIHSFYVPAFRMKQDVLPGRYTQTWFNATKPGVYPLLCAEYCGTDHSRMLGEVTVMSARRLRPLERRPAPARRPGRARRQKLFSSLGCGACHGLQRACRQRSQPARPLRLPGRPRGRPHGHRRRELPARGDRTPRPARARRLRSR